MLAVIVNKAESNWILAVKYFTLQEVTYCEREEKIAQTKNEAAFLELSCAGNL